MGVVNMLFNFPLLLLPLTLTAATSSPYDSRPFANYIESRSIHGSQAANASALDIDLGYSIYRGHTNTSASINIWQGIRFAQPPLGKLRWQAPRPPTVNRSTIIPATKYASICPQAAANDPLTGSISQNSASEDCLYLNVWSPSNATKPLPVLVYIHGGGYGQGNSQMDQTPIIHTNNNSFIGVTIQYRLGAFGFLSSDEVFRRGTVNAGLLDQLFALQWVQEYIHLFNGDPTQVTIAGESAGAGSVMLLDMAYGGSLGTQLFRNSIASSPYLPMQYGYKDWVPSQAYYAFAAQVGCDNLKPREANGTVAIFDCLVNATSEALINASATVSVESVYGTWAFLPVTDGVLIQDLPSRQLARGKVNGMNILSGNNADEGYLFTPQDIQTEDDLVAWLQGTFPLFSNNDIAKILYYYPTSNASTNPNATLYATNGQSGPTALNQSSTATGQQARADTIYAETTFICPSYWLVEAYSNNGLGGQGYKYQFSVPPALHGGDIGAVFDWPGTSPYSYDFDYAFQQTWGRFIVSSNPSIPSVVANGVTTASTNTTVNPASTWPPYTIYAPSMIDLNTTCGTDRITLSPGQPFQAWSGPGTYNRISLVDAYSWEGGRGVRCDFWKSVGEIVPE